MEIQDANVNKTLVVEENHQTLAEEEIQAWLVSYLADLLDIDSDEIDITLPFNRYDIDSSASVGMTGDLEKCFGRKLEATLLYDYPTIELLVRYLSKPTSNKT
ncbi:MAG TPA: acyl carrier protein [Candidatus Sericytochromatia bacterium]